MPIEPGQSVGDYEILELLGKGGMGRVYRVRNRISNRVEAMKVLLDNLSADPDLAERFTTEIRTLARLEHPKIAKLHTAVTVGDQLVMVMEFIEGATLAERVKQGPVALDQIVNFTSQTLSALSYAHSAGVIHRDVKPSNVMITPGGTAKLMDFGIAKSETNLNQTRTGLAMGSMLYMSPEQVRGASVDARSDIYSVGVMLYELATGKRPFDGDTTHAILDAQLNQPPKPPLEVIPTLPRALNEIILTAMAKEPERRFQSAEAFRKALATLEARPAAAPAAAAAVAPAAGKSKRGLWMALGAVACLCVLVAAAMTLPQVFKTQAAPKAAALAEAPAVAPAKAPEPAKIEQAKVEQPTVEQAKVEQAKVEQPKIEQPRIEERKAAAPLAPAPIAPPPPPPPAPTPQAQAPVGPSPEQIEAVNDDLMKLRARADAVRGSLDHLRAEQAAAGLNLNPSVSAGASRMENDLRAAEQALAASNLDAARKFLERADSEVTKLEAFFGR